MRDQLPDRTRPRNLGALDPRISNYVRKQNDSNIMLEIGTPLVWYKADDIDMSAQGTVPSTVTDRMGVAWAHPTNASDPVKQQGAINGRNAILCHTAFSGAIAATASAAVTTAADVTVFVVMSFSTPIAGTPIIVQKGTINVEWLFFQDTNGGNDRVTFRYKSANNAEEVFTLGVAANGARRVLAGRGSAAAANLYVNGVLGTNTVPTAPLGSVSSAISIGANPGGGTPANPFSGLVSEVVVYGSYLSDANRSAGEKYLGREYAIAIS